MRTLSRRSFAIGLLVALLVTFTGRAVSVFAMADPAPVVELFPVYDTTIVQLGDYVDNLTDPQFEIMKIALGMYVASQAGSQNYKLNDPFANSDSVIDWFKSVGIEAYNSIIGLTPDTIRDPITGSIISTTQLKEDIKFMVAYGMGAAVLAANYPTEQAFLDDIDNSDHFFIDYGIHLQPSINNLVAINGGFNLWQLSTDIPASFSWRTITLTSSAQDSYNSLVNTFTYRTPFNCNRRLINNSYWPNYALNGMLNFDTSIFNTYRNIFVNPSNRTYDFYDDNGNLFYQHVSYPIQLITSYSDGTSNSTQNISRFYTAPSYPSTLSKEDVIRNIFNSTLPTFNSEALSSNTNIWISIPALLLQGVEFKFFYGTDWAHRISFDVTSDLNLDDGDMTPYYNQIQTDYLFDIKQYIQDLINTTDLYLPWINNLYTPDGIVVTDPQLTRVSIEILNTINDLNPPLPVNLNDISDYTDNTYLERLKEHARSFGDTFAAYVAFWHNADHDLVYTLFGASIMVLIGAFIGKWGHS